MKKTLLFALCAALLLCSGCSGRKPEQEEKRAEPYQYVVGISLSNIMEPWLRSLVDDFETRAKEEGTMNVIVRDAASSASKQLEDMKELVECGIDLLIAAPDDAHALSSEIARIQEHIPVLVLGVMPDTDEYTCVIEFDDYAIGRLAGKYILENRRRENGQIVVFQGVSGSPISNKRQSGLLAELSGKIKNEEIVYLEGNWLRDKAENRMKDYLIANERADIVFAFNDEMAYGAYLAAQQYRVADIKYIGVGGFDNEDGGKTLVQNGAINATIECSAMGETVYRTVQNVLNGGEIEKHIVLEAEFFS